MNYTLKKGQIEHFLLLRWQTGEGLYQQPIA